MSRLGTGIALLIIVACSPFFFVGGPGYHSSRSFQALWDLGHIIVFALITLVVAFHSNRCTWAFFRRFFFAHIFLLVLVLGIIVEQCQTAVNGRDLDIADLVRNQLGCIFGYYIFSFHHHFDSSIKEKGRHVLVACCFCFACFPLLIGLGDELIARSQFPLLADFESGLEKKRWVDQRQLTISGETADHGDYALKVRLSTATYSGASLFHFPGNWKGYHWLHFSAFNPNPTPLTLHCRVHDKEHRIHNQKYRDRYHHTFKLKPGWNPLRISLVDVENAPESRKMNMGAIEQVGFFVMNLQQPQYIYMDYLYLSR